jgi:two-component system, OmpR family, sensor histidine kinase KdpD
MASTQLSAPSDRGLGDEQEPAMSADRVVQQGQIGQRLLDMARAASRPPLLRFLIAALLPVLAGLVAQLMFVTLGVTQLSFVFITSVICAGGWLGARPALLAGCVAFAIYNFFLVEPQFSLRLASADDFVTLLLFLAAALVTGGLAGRMRDQTEIARRRLQTTQALFEASRRLALVIEPGQIAEALAQSAAQALDGRAFVLVRNDIAAWDLAAASPTISPSAEELAKLRSLCVAPRSDANWRIEFMDGRRGVLAALAVEADAHAPRANDDTHALAALAKLGAVALERSALVAEMAETQALAKSERLRSTMLSSLSHDFRTPLAAILASSTTLLDYTETLNTEAKNELLRSIHEETERMTRFVSHLLEMTRVEAGALKPRIVDADLADIAADAAAHLERQAGEKTVRIIRAGAPLRAKVDPVLLEQALVNIIANAVDFSPVGATVRIDVMPIGLHTSQIVVTDAGPGIPQEALTRVFEKFFRVPDQISERRGAGLGLSIAKSLIEAMDGRLRAESPADDGCGARFIVSFAEPGDACS